MCVVSFVSEHYGDGTGRNWPQPIIVPYPAPGPAPVEPLKPLELDKIAPPTLPWTQETLDLMKKILAELKELDKKLGLPNCEDPKKAEWIAAVEERITALEKKKKSKKKQKKAKKPQLLTE